MPDNASREEPAGRPEGLDDFGGLADEFLPSLHWQVLQTLEDFDVVATPATGAILFPRRFASEKLVRDLHAAAAATALGLKSLDHTRRTYTQDPPPSDRVAGPLVAYVRAYQAAQEHIRSCAGALRTNDAIELSIGTFAASVALERLQSGFVGMHLLYRLGLNFEGDAVARQVLEQIAWSVRASRVTDDEDLGAVSATRAISDLKGLVPFVGPLYGLLSGSTHAGVQQHREVVQLDDRSRVSISISWSRHAVSATTLLLLADLWVVAYERTQRDHMTRFVAIDPSNDFNPNPDRPFLANIRVLVNAIDAAELSSPSRST